MGPSPESKDIGEGHEKKDISDSAGRNDWTALFGGNLKSCGRRHPPRNEHGVPR